VKKVVILLITLVCIALFVIALRKENNLDAQNKRSSLRGAPQEVKSSEEKTSLFVPYWTLNGSFDDWNSYDSLIYFGITPTENGINTSEAGYLGMSDFIESAGEEKQKLLVLRMLNSSTNFIILKDNEKQKKIIAEVISIVKEYGFDGIVLDLELSALPFDSLIKQINSFNRFFYMTTKKEKLIYQVTMYGDTFYRIRPFDVKDLAENSDQIMIMAYDLSKASGNPGPNFPLSGKERYGYDYSLLVDAFLAEVPSEKISVIFGLYGYNWHADNKDIALSVGKPMSYLEIKNTISTNCENLACVQIRDPLSAEVKITYTSEDGKGHVIWHEDMESVSVKQNYLRSKGIYNFSFWAYSYF